MKGGEYGTAEAAQVLSGYTVGRESGVVPGTITNNGAVTITPGATNKSIPAGFHNGSGIVDGDADLVASNIKSGITIFGVQGTLNPSNGVSGQISQAVYNTNYSVDVGFPIKAVDVLGAFSGNDHSLYVNGNIKNANNSWRGEIVSVAGSVLTVKSLYNGGTMNISYWVSG